jgi:hypothetical protein
MFAETRFSTPQEDYLERASADVATTTHWALFREPALANVLAAVKIKPPGDEPDGYRIPNGGVQQMV